MFPRPAWACCCAVLLAGCHSVILLNDVQEGPGARLLWEKGEAAFQDGNRDEALAFYEQSLAADPSAALRHLKVAAIYLEAKDDAKGCPHLASYLLVQPDNLAVRLHYAEALLRLRRLPEARDQFERFDALAQDNGVSARRHLIHCHSQLMEIAETRGSDYEEHLHRGIGLFLLAQDRAQLGDDDCELTVEGLLCKAADELSLAHERQPEEARASWYLWRVWSRLGQRQLALRSLRDADAAALLADMTPAERRELHRACLDREAETRVHHKR